MTGRITEGELLWQPSEDFKQHANITRYLSWLAQNQGLHFSGYHDLWEWSVTHLEAFWESTWRYFDIKTSVPYTTVLSEHAMPGARWFSGARLNYAEHAFRHISPSRPALIFQSERSPLREISWEELARQVASVAHALRQMGVRRGDRVVAYMPNIPETVIAFLASASIGAVWSSCSPDFGTRSVIDRFRQIEPTILFAADGYYYNGKVIDRRAVVAELQQALPTLAATILVPYVFEDGPPADAHRAVSWAHLLANTAASLTFEQVPAAHPLWILFSSGTTGLPKAIVQSHGGIVLEHLKALSLHLDLKSTDRFFWFTTTGWMMWNFLVGGLLCGATIVLYDGSPAFPDLNRLWELVSQAGITVFGTSAGFLTSCMTAGITPASSYEMKRLKSIGVTGSPLPPEGFQWVYEQVKQEIWLISTSGGTDVCTAFVGGCPLLPVHAGEIQCRCLAARVEAFDEQGHSLTDRVGELVVTEPMPSMPLYFWNDVGNRRYQESYFSTYPGVWRHGDWIKITSRGSAVIYGRSDSTINRMGVRMGSSEIYRAVEDLPEVLDSLIVGVELPAGRYYMPLFVVLKEGVQMDHALQEKIKAKIRSDVSPRHVPDDIYAVSAVPRTLNGKKLEVPVKKLLTGMLLEQAVNPDSMSNPESIQYYVDLARKLGLSTPTSSS
ncbi:MAG: acetoacetate--CoA ligase [Ktedonobacteraceae bacterium]|nr:acetoacetate--CoA ligase [Ktedonobacteraceae bacterium]